MSKKNKSLVADNIPRVQTSDFTASIAQLAAAKVTADPSISIDEAVRQATEALRRASVTQLTPKQIADSVKPDKLMCFEDGTWHTMLRRYNQRKFGLGPDAYRAKWSLPDDYPLVAPEYAKARAKIAKKTGLGKSNKKIKK